MATQFTQNFHAMEMVFEIVVKFAEIFRLTDFAWKWLLARLIQGVFLQGV